ncbi:MAG: metallophosphoesterase [Bryobacterales bacterium]|nr:metallophosphoesterase [Bryobacterales bacterium]
MVNQLPVGVRQIPDAVALALVLLAQWRLSAWALRSEWARGAPRRRVLLHIWRWAGLAWTAYGIVSGVGLIARLIPPSMLRDWARGMAIIYGMCIIGVWVLHELIDRVPAFNPRRRRLLEAVRASAIAAPAAVCGYGVFVERNDFRMSEVDLPIPGLPRGLHGLRLAQITDIHFSNYLGEKELLRAIGMANETRPHLTLLTGDFITVRRDPLDHCLRLLTRLRAEAGIYGCLGNHEILAGCEDYTEQACARLGITILRSSARSLRFGEATLNLAGVDYQRTQRPYLEDTAGLIAPGAMNLLLSHNPDVFPVAAAQGWQATISGHTHGGQVNVELLGENLNVARFFTPYVYGPYREGVSSIYVSRGLGTVGAPIRIGAPPEVNLIRLCAT